MLIISSQKDDVITVGMSIVEKTLDFLMKAFAKLQEIELDGFFIRQVQKIESQNYVNMQQYFSTESSATSPIPPFKQVEYLQKSEQKS